MKKPIILFTLFTIMLTLFLTACSSKDTSESSRLMTVDINPSIEFVLDESGKVVSVTALNDDGAVVLSGEVFVGLSAEEAAEKFVSVSVDTGFISKDDAKEIKITVTGDDFKKVYSNVKDKVSDAISSLGIESKITQGQALAREQLEKYVLNSDSLLTEEDISKLTDNELINKLAEIRSEYKDFITEDLRNAYSNFKESKISFKEKDEVKKVIESLGDAYASLLNSYSEMLASLDTASESVNEVYYNNFISEESAYQKAVKEVKDARLKLVAIKNAENIQELYDVLSSELFESFPEISTILSTLNVAIQFNLQDNLQSTYDNILSTITNTLDTMLDAAESSLELAKTAAESAVDVVTKTLTDLKQQLTNLEKTFPEEIKTALTNNAALMEENLNKAKDSLLSAFEEDYKSAMEKINSDLASQKQALIDAVNKE